VPDGYYLNPSGYAAPAPGQWGTAGRNAIVGPRQFSLDAGVGRTFLWGDRLNLDWRLNATNVLNRVTYAAVNAVVGSAQFGLPTVANPMRKVQASLRLRFDVADKDTKEAASVLAFVSFVTFVRSVSLTAQQAPPVFRSGARLIVQTVSVKDKDGRAVEGLTANDFIVSEDGEPQTGQFRGVPAPDGPTG